MLRGRNSPARLAVSIGLGVFIGCLPTYGFHIWLCLAVCVPLQLDAVAAYFAANISNPLVAPFLIVGEVETGSYMLHGVPAPFDLSGARRVGIGGFLAEAALGSLVVGGGLALALGGLTWVLTRGRVGTAPLDTAIRRTVKRYGETRLGDRFYVGPKLRSDPVTRQVAQLGPLGDVVDAGAGRGQLGLFLLELGHVASLTGFDLDPRKVDSARRAAGEQASFAVADLCDFVPSPADTVLLIDVLHYLELPSQDQLLERAARAVRAGGRLLVRENDLAARRSLVTHLSEWVATSTGYNRAENQLGFRNLSEIVAILEREGLRCEMHDSGLANRLVIASRPPE
jgi:uncharacterized protein (DUF2062 family)/SAM-dependent methyltransferase